MTALYVALGGALGAVARYGIMVLVGKYVAVSQHFPVGTLLVNIIGSLLIGCAIAFFSKTLPHSMEMRAFLVVGVLGGFTTFSTFSLDVVSLIERGALWLALAYVTLSVVAGVGSVFLALYYLRS